MMKRLLITLMVGLSTMAAVSCNKVERRTEDETGLYKAKDIKAVQIAAKYDQKVKIEAYKENGDVKNYYVSWTHPVRYTNGAGQDMMVNLTYVEKYDTNLTVTDYNIAYNYEEAMATFAQAKP